MPFTIPSTLRCLFWVCATLKLALKRWFFLVFLSHRFSHTSHPWTYAFCRVLDPYSQHFHFYQRNGSVFSQLFNSTLHNIDEADTTTPEARRLERTFPQDKELMRVFGWLPSTFPFDTTYGCCVVEMGASAKKTFLFVLSIKRVKEVNKV